MRDRIGVLLLVLLAAGYWYVTGGRYVSTDDAYVQAARVQVSTDVSGRVEEIDAASGRSGAAVTRTGHPSRRWHRARNRPAL